MSNGSAESFKPELSRLTRLLGYLERDAGNLRLRKDAIGLASGSGLWKIGRGLIDAGLQIDPADAELLAWGGMVDLKAQRYRHAESEMSAAVAQGVETAEIRYHLACSYFMQRRFTEAMKQLSAPLMPFELPLALKLQARCQHFLGKTSDAIASCRKYLSHAAEDPECNGLLALLLFERAELEAAGQHAQIALTQDRRQQEALLTRASIEFDAADYGTARRSFEELVKSHPHCGRGWLGLALIKLKDMQLHAARNDIELAANHMPDHIGTWHVLAWIRILLGDVLGAELAFDKALELDRNFGESHGGLAVIAALDGRSSDARVRIKRALRLNPQALSPRYAEMLILRQQGRLQEADALLQEVLSRPVAHSDMQYRDLVTLHTKHLQRMPPP
jgi:tetratricopeptide (TPR) repeat protein